MARLKRLDLSAGLVLGLLTTDASGPAYRCRLGVPAGAEIVDVRYDAFRQVATILMRHDSFEDVPEGDIIPHLDPAYEYRYKAGPAAFERLVAACRATKRKLRKRLAPALSDALAATEH